MKAYLFPGQGSQFVGMGKDLYDKSDEARKYFEQANDLLGFNIARTMFRGTESELKRTNITQPAIFLYSVIAARTAPSFAPELVAGHSLGEFSALVGCGAISFEDGLALVTKRAQAMRKACQMVPSTMAAIIGMEEEKVDEICKNIPQMVVVANYNGLDQIVVSGTMKGVKIACEKCLQEGAKRAIELAVDGAFHSPLMQPAAEELSEAIDEVTFTKPVCHIFQNVDAKPHRRPEEIKENLKKQLTAPVRWSSTILNMVASGVEKFIDCGPGSVVKGLVKRVNTRVPVGLLPLLR